MRVIFCLFLLFNAYLSAKSISFFRYPQYENMAKNLVQAYELQGNYQHLKKNLTYFLQNFIETHELTKMSHINDAPTILDLVFRNNFWSQKLERDLESPYTDEEFNQYLQSLQNETNVFLAYLEQINPKKSKVDIYIYGSFVKGRFGGSSSLNLKIDSPDEALLLRLENGPYSKTSEKFRGNIEVLVSIFKADFLLEPFRAVTKAQLSDLSELYNAYLNQIGFGYKNGQLVRKITTARAYLEFNPIEDRLFFLHRQLNALEKQFFNAFYDLFVGAENATQQSVFQKQFNSMEEKIIEVINDLELISQQEETNLRYQKIKEVINSASFDRMIRHRLPEMRNLLDQERTRVNRLKTLLNNI